MFFFIIIQDNCHFSDKWLGVNIPVLVIYLTHLECSQGHLFAHENIFSSSSITLMHSVMSIKLTYLKVHTSMTHS